MIVQTKCTERQFTFPKRSFTLTGELEIQNSLFLQNKFRFVSQKPSESSSARNTGKKMIITQYLGCF